MDVEVKSVHIGEEIEKRRAVLNMSKSELGRRIGVSQQHVNRILQRDTMETKKLVEICHALDFNFFALFCEIPKQISAYWAAVALKGNANNIIGDAALAAELAKVKADLETQLSNVKNLQSQVDIQKAFITSLQKNLEDKDAIISLLQKKDE